VRIGVVGGQREPVSFCPAFAQTLGKMTQAVDIMFTAGAKSGREGRSGRAGRMRKAGCGGPCSVAGVRVREEVGAD